MNSELYSHKVLTTTYQIQKIIWTMVGRTNIYGYTCEYLQSSLTWPHRRTSINLPLEHTLIGHRIFYFYIFFLDLGMKSFFWDLPQISTNHMPFKKLCNIFIQCILLIYCSIQNNVIFNDEDLKLIMVINQETWQWLLLYWLLWKALWSETFMDVTYTWHRCFHLITIISWEHKESWILMMVSHTWCDELLVKLIHEFVYWQIVIC
jgi:hypothetical protein